MDFQHPTASGDSIRALNADVTTLRVALAPVEAQAQRLPWSRDRPWTTRTHLGSSNGLPLLDLHSLSVRLALAVVETVLEVELETGGVVFITGRGRHTGGHSKLRAAVIAKLEARQPHDGFMFRPLGPGRVEVVRDGVRARVARPGLGLVFWLFIGLLVLALFAVVLNRI